MKKIVVLCISLAIMGMFTLPTFAEWTCSNKKKVGNETLYVSGTIATDGNSSVVKVTTSGVGRVLAVNTSTYGDEQEITASTISYGLEGPAIAEVSVDDGFNIYRLTAYGELTLPSGERKSITCSTEYK